MPLVARKVWTNQRKWQGNLLPTLFFVPLVAWGVVWMVRKDQILGMGFWLVVAGVVLGWIALNVFGLFGNAFMRRDLKRELAARGVDFTDPHFFVGFSTPRFFSILDAHEDIGFLFLHDEVLEFVGEKHNLKVPRKEVARIRFRPNIHTWVGLGRWICVEGTHTGTKFRMNVEPREKNFLMLNLLGSKAIRNRLERWKLKH